MSATVWFLFTRGGSKGYLRFVHLRVFFSPMGVSPGNGLLYEAASLREAWLRLTAEAIPHWEMGDSHPMDLFLESIDVELDPPPDASNGTLTKSLRISCRARIVAQARQMGILSGDA